MPAGRSVCWWKSTARATSWPAATSSSNWYTTLPCTLLPPIRSIVRKEDVTPEAFEKEKDIYRAQAAATGKPAAVVEKIVEGKMGKFYEEVCLYEQPFIKDQTMTVFQLIASVIGKLGENISVKRFARFKVGDVNETVAVSKAADQGAE